MLIPKHSGSKDWGEVWMDWYYFLDVPLKDVKEWMDETLPWESNGPGHFFANQPCVRQQGRRIVVTHRCGYDI